MHESPSLFVSVERVCVRCVSTVAGRAAACQHGLQPSRGAQQVSQHALMPPAHHLEEGARRSAQQLRGGAQASTANPPRVSCTPPPITQVHTHHHREGLALLARRGACEAGPRAQQPRTPRGFLKRFWRNSFGKTGELHEMQKPSLGTL